MYHPKAEKLFYGLLSFLLMMVFFVMSPDSNSQVMAFKDTIKNQLRIGWIQTVGDQPWFSEVGLIYDSVDTFLVKSADAYIELVSNVDADADLVYIVKETYFRFGFARHAVQEEQLIVANIPHFMEQPGITNIVPEGWSENTEQETIPNSKLSDYAKASSDRQILTSTSNGSVAGATVEPSSWAEIKDGITGKIYCIAIYGGEVNKYLGRCAHDYY